MTERELVFKAANDFQEAMVKLGLKQATIIYSYIEKDDEENIIYGRAGDSMLSAIGLCELVKARMLGYQGGDNDDIKSP